MHRNVWQDLFPVSQNKKKLCFKTDTKNRSIVRHGEHKVFFLGRDEKAFTEGSRGNGFKSDQESHNNQNLLNDLFHSSWIECTRILLATKRKVEQNRFEEIKGEQGLRWWSFLGIFGETFLKIKYDWNKCLLNVWIMTEFHANSLQECCEKIFAISLRSRWNYSESIKNHWMNNNFDCSSVNKLIFNRFFLPERKKIKW